MKGSQSSLSKKQKVVFYLIISCMNLFTYLLYFLTQIVLIFSPSPSLYLPFSLASPQRFIPLMLMDNSLQPPPSMSI